MPGIYPDYPASIVRNGNVRRELAMARWGVPSSQKASARAGSSGISTAISQNFSQWIHRELSWLTYLTSLRLKTRASYARRSKPRTSTFGFARLRK
jgi:hypothetical protein